MRTEFEVFVCGLEFSLNLIKNKRSVQVKVRDWARRLLVRDRGKILFCVKCVILVLTSMH